MDTRNKSMKACLVSKGLLDTECKLCDLGREGTLHPLGIQF
jgi:hypothetical protein